MPFFFNFFYSENLFHVAARNFDTEVIALLLKKNKEADEKDQIRVSQKTILKSIFFSNNIQKFNEFIEFFLSLF